eukprot:GILK01016709.1.p1 GENE.GILK01016709.1~~GILK01016709.1.p1  ORF type:complete len:451 (+),score=36.95 GILK01016709.1:39-1391(+)
MAKSKESKRSKKSKDSSGQETEVQSKRKVSDDATFELSSGSQEHKRRKLSSANNNPETNGLLQPDVSNACCDEQEKVQTKRQKFVFGNYDAYYGYRTTDRWNDPRLSLFKRRWFEGKRCLDVGCNAGFLTISIAKRFHCSYILGIDIDSKLVAEAQRQLRLAKKSLQEEEHTTTSSSTQTPVASVSVGHAKHGSVQGKPSNKHIVFDDEGDAHDVAPAMDSIPKNGVPLKTSSTSSTSQTIQTSSSPSITSSASSSSSNSSSQQSVPVSIPAPAMALALLPRALMLKAKPASKTSASLPSSSNSTTITPPAIPASVLPVSTPLDHVYFMTENFVYSSPHDESYDLIQCLSVTKWIHFNWGDEGIKRVFHKVFSMLKPRGRFLLEPQPWKSYKKKYALTETTKRNYRGIELRPDDFPKFLIEEVGFRSYETLHSSDRGSKGFDRPIYLFRK